MFQINNMLHLIKEEAVYFGHVMNLIKADAPSQGFANKEEAFITTRLDLFHDFFQTEAITIRQAQMVDAVFK